jgi:hypothetical protein
MLLSGANEELVLVYADEHIPPECGCFFREEPVPFAFGLLLSRNSLPLSVPLSSLYEEDSPLAFLKRLLLCGKLHVSC